MQAIIERLVNEIEEHIDNYLDSLPREEITTFIAEESDIEEEDSDNECSDKQEEIDHLIMQQARHVLFDAIFICGHEDSDYFGAPMIYTNRVFTKELCELYMEKENERYFDDMSIFNEIMKDYNGMSKASVDLLYERFIEDVGRSGQTVDDYLSENVYEYPVQIVMKVMDEHRVDIDNEDIKNLIARLRGG